MKKIIIIAIIGVLLGFTLVYANIVQPSQSVLGETTDSSPDPIESVVDQFSFPSRLVIEKIGVDAEIEQVGLDEQQRMDVPAQDENVAWYKYGAIPGDNGSAVLAGHFDTKQGTEAVFYELDTLDAGDEIIVYDNLGNQRTFVVEKTELYPDSGFPIDQVFGLSDGKRLQLITCAGSFDQMAKNYQDRLVVYSVLQE